MRCRWLPKNSYPWFAGFHAKQYPASIFMPENRKKKHKRKKVLARIQRRRKAALIRNIFLRSARAWEARRVGTEVTLNANGRIASVVITSAGSGYTGSA
jgi:hypothetical protein